MHRRELIIGDVVQISPEYKNQMLAACFLTVTEPKPWGCLGYVQCTGTDGDKGGPAFLRLDWKDMEYIGPAAFMIRGDNEEPFF